MAQRFNIPAHSLEDVRVLKSGLAKKDVRQRKEMRQSFTFQTLAPGGIRSRFLIYIKSNTREQFGTCKQFQNSTGLQITISFYSVAAKHREEGINTETSVDLYRHGASSNQHVFLNNSSFLSRYAVELLLSGQPQENGMWLLNRHLEYFSQSGKFLGEHGVTSREL